MKPATQLAEEIFSAAIALPSTERNAYLASRCSDDSATLERVRELIDGYEKNSSFLEQPVCIDGALGTPPLFEPGPGHQIGPYRLVEKIGEGGFGIVYLAEQVTPVRRRVALKLIRIGLDTREFIARFADERQALALMDHPNIARVFDAGATETGRPYLVMEFIAGQPITRYCDERRLTVRQRLELFVQVCSALQHAHQKGVIHRDLKPSNILVAEDGGAPVPKLIDFGVAKAIREPLSDRSLVTQQHTLIGTPVYTSPEQIDVHGDEADTRSDIYSLGALLYELLAGTPPFERGKLKSLGLDELRRTIREVEPTRPSARIAAYSAEQRHTVAATREVEAEKLSGLLRTELDWIVMRCLEKAPPRRYDTASALAADIRHYLNHEPVTARPPSTVYRAGKFMRRYWIGVAASLAIVGVTVVGLLVTTLQARRALRAELEATEARQIAAKQTHRLEKTRWARETALPQISRLMKTGDIAGAFAVAKEAEEFLPGDPALANVWPSISATVSVETTPAGADIYAKPYDQPASPWQYLGKSPLKDLRLARCVYRWRIEKAGYVPAELADGWWWIHDQRDLTCTLYTEDATPHGMVRVQFRPTFRPQLLPPFWIDRCEVTNREFKEFVAQGGYANEKFWKVPFVQDGKTLNWSEAIALFHDQTGQPGPAGWTNGSYPENEADFPVTGVSWFEAAAYAEFAGKRLPSVNHWRQAAPSVGAEYLLPFSNVESERMAAVGSYQGINTCGAVDMVGNAKEWCWNETSDGRRILLGGGWAEPNYMFGHLDAFSPFGRESQFGFRCIKTDPDTADPAGTNDPITPVIGRDFTKEQPVSDGEFEFFKRLYAYDRVNLQPSVEAGGAQETARWRRERVSFNTAYNGERMSALIYIPRSVRAPFQAVVYYPGVGARSQLSSENPRDFPVIETLLATGRIVVHPVYLGTYERRLTLAPGVRLGEMEGAEMFRHQVQDILRTLDYLETRTDLAPGKVAFAGFSSGVGYGPVVSSIDPRIKVNLLIAGGFIDSKIHSDVDPFNYAPHVTVPTLMINGRHDFIRPLETSQLPLFRALGTTQKKHLLLEGGHGASITPYAAEIRDWLDQVLGPVNEASGNR